MSLAASFAANGSHSAQSSDAEDSPPRGWTRKRTYLKDSDDDSSKRQKLNKRCLSQDDVLRIPLPGTLLDGDQDPGPEEIARRRLYFDLPHASPQIHFTRPLPDGPATALSNQIMVTMLDGFCPTQLRKQIDPMMFLHEREFADGLLGGFAADDLLAKVDGILEAARICRDQSRDKAAWDNIAFSVLDLVIEMDRRESGDRAKFELLDM